MSARLFASVILVMKRQEKRCYSVDLLIPLLRSIVQTEVASLRDTKIKHKGDQKKVHFCSTNNSSMINPVDTEEGSEQVVEYFISCMFNALKEMEILPLDVKNTTLSVFVKTLEQISMTSSSPILKQCSAVSVKIVCVFFCIY